MKLNFVFEIMLKLLATFALIGLSACKSNELNEGAGEDSSALESSRSTNQKTFTGSLVTKGARGGETTGYGLKTDSIVIELDLDTYGFSNRFEIGKTVTVKGHYKTFPGTEGPSRQVLVVETFRG